MGSTDNAILIRQMRPEDSDEICRIFTEITKQPVEADFADLIKLPVHGKNFTSLVAEFSGKLVGFIVCYIITLGFGVEESGWIATIGVDPRHMGQGIGARLAEEIFKSCKSRGITRVYTSVKWDSTDLLSFFRTLDFERSDFINLTKKLG